MKKSTALGLTSICVVLLASGCDSKTEDKELTARIVAQLDAQKTPEQRAADAKRAAEDAAAKAKANALLARMVGEARVVRDALKNPKSFELVSMAYIEKTETTCMVYRGTNSFNAVITEQFAANPGKAVDWNKFCAGKSGSDWAVRVRDLL